MKQIKVTERIERSGQKTYTPVTYFPVTTAGLRAAIQLRRATPTNWPKMEIVDK